MDRFARTVLGYHGCDPDFAEKILNGAVPIGEWQPSTNDYDWLGHGIYFWEYAPERALTWANRPGARKGGVIGAIIQLGNCLDLTDVNDTRVLGSYFESMRLDYQQKEGDLPVNRDGRNSLDCLVINEFSTGLANAGNPLQTIRCPFIEGGEIYPGSMIREQSHVQLVVKDHRNILGVFRPNLTEKGEAR